MDNQIIYAIRTGQGEISAFSFFMPFEERRVNALKTHKTAFREIKVYSPIPSLLRAETRDNTYLF